MIRCTKCGYVGSYYGINCPSCKEVFALTPEEIEEKIAEIEKAEELKEYELAAEGHHILADMGRTESQKKYAALLEKGDLVPRNLDAAMEYYYMAAEKNDPTAAYRYALLAERTSDKVASFWLAFAAALGCVESYPTFADRLARDGDNELSNFYYALAAAYDDTDSMLTLAKRYYSGTGIEENHAYAKWYIDKLPPFQAFMMARKLRTVKAEDPGFPKHPDYNRMVRRLAIKAQDYGYHTAYHALCKILYEKGDIQATMTLGTLYAEGIGCERDIDTALALLASSAASGNAEAYRRMGDMYVAGKLVTRDIDKALECYRAAADLGMTNAYETMGDIFRHGELIPRDVARAIELYDLGAKEGHSTAREKSDTLKDERERLCGIGIQIKYSSPQQSFRAFAISSSMGYVPAYKEVARSFLEGCGIKKSRSQAYLWFEKAVESGDDEALYEYALCYSRGIGTAFNFKRATALLTKAARLGSPEAKAELERLFKNRQKCMLNKAYSQAMTLIYKKQFAEAEEMLRVCLRLGHPKGIYTLGCLNEFGLGIPTNREMAFRLYETAFDLKFRDPKSIYKLRILRMVRNYN